MSDEEFRNYLSRMEYNDGLITMNGARYLIVPAKWFGDLTIEAENVMGVSGTFAIFDNASRRTVPDPNTLATLKQLPFEHRIGAFLKSAAWGGFGNIEVIELSKDPFMVRLKCPSPVYGDAYNGSADSPRCYFNNTWIPYFEEFAKMEGQDIRLRVRETQCVAEGAPYCEVFIEPDTMFD